MTTPVAARRTRSPLRLTRRGRIVLVLTVMLLVLIAGFTLGNGSSLAAGRSAPVQHSVIVRPGETLWALAARVAPQQDPRLVVADIESRNGLTGAAVQPGQQLIVPNVG